MISQVKKLKVLRGGTFDPMASQWDELQKGWGPSLHDYSPISPNTNGHEPLSGLEHWLILQKTQVQCSAPTGCFTTDSTSSFGGNNTLFWSPRVQHAYGYTHITPQTLTCIKNNNEIEKKKKSPNSMFLDSLAREEKYVKCKPVSLTVSLPPWRPVKRRSGFGTVDYVTM